MSKDFGMPLQKFLKDFEIYSEEEALHILAEVKKVAETPEKLFYDPAFAAQMAFIRDPAKLKAAQCPRRAGKTNAVGYWLLEPVCTEESITTLYIAKTRDSAKDIMWRDVVKDLNKRLGLGLKPHETDLTLTHVSLDSQLKIAGADAGPDELKKYLGRKVRRVAIDESADFRQDLESLVFEILWPALADWEGELALIGTAGQMCKGLFYEVTTGKRPGWSVHKWSASDNPYMKDKIYKSIQALRETNPRIEETPSFRRNYLNEWVPELTKLCYRYNPLINDCEVIPERDGEVKYVLGVDLGFTDDSAFALCNYSSDDPTLYFEDLYKRKGMIISDVAERIAYYIKRYNPYKIVIDGAAKQAVEELKQKFCLPLDTAEKQGKAEFIEIMNSDYIQGRIKLLQPVMKELGDEYSDLIWDDKASKREEHPACDNHGADAALYAWRECYHYLSKKVKQIILTETEKVDEWERREIEKLAEKDDKPFWEREL